MSGAGGLAWFDEALLVGEKRVVAAIVLVMGAAVFADVFHRQTPAADAEHLGSWLVVAALGTVVAALALRWRGERYAAPRGAGVGVGVAVAGFFFKLGFPDGLVWSQPFALALTLWLGMVGASLAAHERRHLALDIGSKLWPAHLAPKMAAIGHLVTGAFCVLLLVLAARSLQDHWSLWQDTEHAGGTLSGTAIPKWTAAAAIPYGMAVLAFRFTLEAWRTWTGQIALPGDDTLHQLGIQEPVSP